MYRRKISEAAELSQYKWIIKLTDKFCSMILSYYVDNEVILWNYRAKIIWKLLPQPRRLWVQYAGLQSSPGQGCLQITYGKEFLLDPDVLNFQIDFCISLKSNAALSINCHGQQEAFQVATIQLDSSAWFLFFLLLFSQLRNPHFPLKQQKVSTSNLGKTHCALWSNPSPHPVSQLQNPAFPVEFLPSLLGES